MTRVVWLDVREIIAIQLELLNEHGGLAGIRDEGLLESALARPQHPNAYGSPSLAELAAAYGFGLTRNHPFLDGNKRIALAAIGVFLDVNGYGLTAPQTDAVEMILTLASGNATKPQLSAWIKANMRKDRLH